MVHIQTFPILATVSVHVMFWDVAGGKNESVHVVHCKLFTLLHSYREILCLYFDVRSFTSEQIM